MKKWIVCLTCLLLAAVIAIFVIVQNNHDRVDGLNRELYENRSEINSLKEKAAEDEKQIQELDTRVGDLTEERDQLATEKGKLEESLENMNRNLTSSQQKLQGVLYILTDGVQGNIDGILSPFIKIYQDVGLENPYFETVSHVTEHRLMSAREEELFGVDEKATLGEMAEGVYIMKHLTGTRADATNALLNTEKTWLSAQQPAEKTQTEEEAPAEEPAEEAAATEAPAEEAVTEEAAAEEGTPAEEPAEEAAATEAPSEEAVTEEAAAEEAADDESTVLTRERLLGLCKAVCYENGWAEPEIALPESEDTEANRGDLAIILAALDQIEK